MEIEEDRIKAMNFEYPEHVPGGVSFLPATWTKYREALDDLVARHPIVCGERKEGGRDYDAVEGTYAAGEHRDAWGCGWRNVASGMQAIVTDHPVPTREAVHKLKAPQVDGPLKHGFLYLRLADLRGFDELMMDFADEPPELQMLIDVVLEYNMRQLRNLLASQTEEGLLYFGDDLGTQKSLPMSPQKWRKYLKPCYSKMYRLCHEAGHQVYMHSDGHIIEIIPDLVECGVNVINAQVRANGLRNLARTCKGKVCVALDLDRQMFPFCSPDDIESHVREAVETLGSPKGGLWLEAECAPDVPLENIEAICNALEKYRSYFN